MGLHWKFTRETPEPFVSEDLLLELERFVNEHRARCGLRTLEADAALASAARGHAVRMRDAEFFSHTDPGTGSMLGDRMAVADSGAWEIVCENLAAGMWRASDVLGGWLASPSHRVN